MSSFNLPYAGGFTNEGGSDNKIRRNFSEIERRLDGVMKRYTPTLKSSAGIQPTGWTSEGWYYTIGKMAWFQFKITTGPTYNSGTSAEVRITLPVTPVRADYPDNMRIGTGHLVSYGMHVLTLYIPPGVLDSELSCVLQPADGGGVSAVMATNNVAANGEIWGHGFYEFS